MGLQSLAGDRHHTGLTEPAAAFFEKRSARMLGVADNSFVFQDPSDTARVIKLSLAPQDGWSRWADWCSASYLERYGKHLPVVYARQRMGGLLVAHVERLEPLCVSSPIRRAMRLHKRDAAALAQAWSPCDPVADLLMRIAVIFPDAHWDLGPSNWMTRPGCGTLVLNDPISHVRQ